MEPLTNSVLGHDHHHRNAALDGVRAIAILLVFAVHTKPQLLVGGRLGVDLFFVLSGFLITSILLREYDATGSIHLGKFYMRRALRLFPALFLVVVFVIGFTAVTERGLLSMTLADARAILLYYFNWRLVGMWPDMGIHNSMFSHLWSLSVEEQFYIVWPLLTLGLLRFRIPRTAVFALLALGIILPEVARSVLYRGGNALDLYFRTDLRFDGLMWGALTAWLFWTDMLPKGERAQRILGWLGVAGVVGLCVLSSIEFLPTGDLYRWVFSTAGLCSMLLIVGVLSTPPRFLKLTIEFRPLRWIGRISYGLYLWHYTIFRAMHTISIDRTKLELLEFLVILAIATASYYVWEMPFLRLKDRVGSSGTRRENCESGLPVTPLVGQAYVTTPEGNEPVIGDVLGR
jgi:peptidoglycan/LPS O-acetylase OafA/YrhL